MTEAREKKKEFLDSLPPSQELQAVRSKVIEPRHDPFKPRRHHDPGTSARLGAAG